MRRTVAHWRSLSTALLQSPPRLVEAVMLMLSLTMLTVWWFAAGWQYLLLCLSYLVGAIASILVREAIHPSSHTLQIRCTALVSLLLVLALAGIYIGKTLHVARLAFL